MFISIYSSTFTHYLKKTYAPYGTKFIILTYSSSTEQDSNIED